VTWVVPIGVAIAIAMFTLAYWLEHARTRRKLLELAHAADAVPSSLYPKIRNDACICTGACVQVCPEKDVLAMVYGRPKLVQPSACIGHGECVRACPVSAIELVLGSRERGVEVPVVTGTFETTVPGMYVAGEVTGMGLIHNALAQGAQAAAAALSGPASGDGEYDLVIVGAGPAGLGAALEAKRRGVKCIVLEKRAFGGAVRAYPRQKIVMTAPFDLPGYKKIQLRRTTKEALLELFESLVQRFALEIVEHAEVTAIQRGDAGFSIHASQRVLTAKRVVIAIGRRGIPRKLVVPGADQPHVVYEVADPAQHAGQPIAVLGGGDSAVELALAFAAQPKTRVMLIHRGADLNRCKPDNQRAALAARAAGRLDLFLSATVRAVTQDRIELEVARARATPLAKLVVCCLGAELPSAWLRELGISLHELRGEPLTR
jgi:thioredoxin reductase/NAD-dependent dihydropyrimidine dehydrogenase PreA subunit